jgi:CBS domain-containing protein
MLANKIGGLPVVDGGKLIGIVTSSDMLRAFLNVVEATPKILKP